MIEQLAAQIDTTNRETPVLVTDRRIGFRAEFFADLAVCLAGQSNRPLLFERLGRRNGFLTGLNSWMLRDRILRRIERLNHGPIDMLLQDAAMPTPRRATSRFVVGFCSDTIELPPWVTRLSVGM